MKKEELYKETEEKAEEVKEEVDKEAEEKIEEKVEEVKEEVDKETEEKIEEIKEEVDKETEEKVEALKEEIDKEIEKAVEQIEDEVEKVKEELNKDIKDNQSKENKCKKSINNKQNKTGKKIKLIKIIILILLVLILGYLGIMELCKNNEEIEVKIIGSRHSVNWSDASQDVKESEDFEKFKEILKESGEKFDKTIVIFNQFVGCASCIDGLLENLSQNIKELNDNKIGVLLVTTLDDDYIKSQYKEESKLINIISDSNLEISKNIDMYNEEYSQVENSILVIEKDNLETYLDEYYYESDEDIINYISSYIPKK